LGEKRTVGGEGALIMERGKGEREREKQYTGDYTRKTFPQNY